MMARESERAAMRLLKELFLSVFVLFYKIAEGGWPPEFNADAHKGVFGVSVIESLLIFSVLNWIEIITGHRFFASSPWVGGILALVLYIVNMYFLVVRGIGVAFEKQFKHFRLSKRIVLLLCAVGITAATATITHFSMDAYHQAFYTVPLR